MNLIHNEECIYDGALIGDFVKAADLICAQEGVDADICEVSVTFENEEGIRDLNARYRGKDVITDVLSFPMYGRKEELAEEAEPLEEGMVISLGDVVICAEVAKKQATEYGHSERRELVYLFVHSMLHLLGYDHEKENERVVMRVVEEEIMKELGIER